jgi:pimeloyl-ACP methyl ester carboxylesterase
MIETHHAELDGLPVVWRSAGPEAEIPILYLHGVPDHGELWTPFLERTGGVAPDLPGFGASAKRGDLDYSIGGYADWLERFCEFAGLDRVRLVMHDWGVVGLAFAQRAPERIERLVAIDVVPLLPGYRWHPIARAWRTPLLGEVAMGMAIGPVVRRLLPAGRADPVLAAFDPGTQRAILKLYRASPPDVLAAAGARPLHPAALRRRARRGARRRPRRARRRCGALAVAGPARAARARRGVPPLGPAPPRPMAR